MADLAFFRLANQAPLPNSEFIESDLITNAQDGAFLGSVGPVNEIDHGDAYADLEGFVLVEKGSLLSTDSPLGGSSHTHSHGNLLTYTVKDGDTLSSIASNFGLSVSDILSTNDKGSSLIRPGEELAIIPVSSSGKNSTTGDVPSIASSLPSDDGYFIRPIEGGWNWGALHDVQYMPSVDFSDACGTPIYAAAAGKVIKIGSPSYYNQGYGGYILINHSNGTRTLYAHNSVNLVEVGDEVDQGELIAKIGNTGRTYGATGCHVHFGVSGVAHPFAR